VIKLKVHKQSYRNPHATTVGRKLETSCSLL